MGEGHKEWIENRKLFRSLDAIDREMKDHGHHDSDSEHNRRSEAYSRALDQRETPRPAEKERFDDTPSNRSAANSSAGRSSDKGSVDYNHGSRFTDKATTKEDESEEGRKTNPSTSSNGNGDGSSRSETHDDGSYGYRDPTYVDSDPDPEPESESEPDFDAKFDFEGGEDDDDHDDYEDYDDQEDHDDCDVEDEYYDDYDDDGDDDY